MAGRKFDIVIWGATGYTGTLIAEYFAKNVHPSVKWAIAGRTANKLEQLVEKLKAISPEKKNIEFLVGDIKDEASLLNIFSQTKVVIAAAGPFTLCGTPIVDACFKCKTDYVDVTGESPWVKTLIDKYHEGAEREGIHIVPMCGFDSVPFDIGSYMLIKHVESQGTQLKWMKGYAEGIGKPSGGTAHTMLLLASTTPNKIMRDPLLLNPPEYRNVKLPAGASDQLLPKYDKNIKKWTSPFVMSGVNTRVVRRSQYLYKNTDHPYGPDNFYYNECELHSGFFSAFFRTVFLGIFMVFVSIGITRSLLKRLLPTPGEGPSEDYRKKGWFRVTFIGETLEGNIVRAKVSGGDAYKETATFAANAALCLLDKKTLPSAGGVLTSATSMGLNLISKLQVSGIQLEIEQ